MTATAARSAPVAVRVAEGLVDHLQHGLEVVAGGDLRHDAAVLGVEVELRGDDVRAEVAAVLDDGGGGLVAGGLDAEDEAIGHT